MHVAAVPEADHLCHKGGWGTKKSPKPPAAFSWDNTSTFQSGAFHVCIGPLPFPGEGEAVVSAALTITLDPERTEWEGVGLGALRFRQVVTSFVLVDVSPSHVFLFRTVPKNSVFVLLNVLH